MKVRNKQHYNTVCVRVMHAADGGYNNMVKRSE